MEPLSIRRGDWFHQQVKRLSRSRKRLILTSIDIVILAMALWLAVWLRLDDPWPASVWSGNSWLLVAVAGAGAFLLRSAGFYRVVIRSFGRRDLTTLFRAMLMAAVGLAALAHFDTSLFLPRSTPVLFGMMAFSGVAASRYTLRWYAGWLAERGIRRAPVVIFGAGEAGMQLANALDGARQWRAVAFLDDDPALTGSSIAGRKVFRPDQIDKLMHRYGVKDVFMAMPSSTREQRRAAVEALSDRPLRVKTIPSLDDLVSGQQSIASLQDIDVGALLGREEVQPIDGLDTCVRGKTILVTGAGGSIGAELCRQILGASPSKLVLFEASEFALYTVERELAGTHHHDLVIVAVLGSVCNERLLDRVFSEHRPHTVFHAAAYKHVPLVEANPVEGVGNNALGARAVAQAARRSGVERVMLVSTDKAVRPTSIMGASKRMAELAFLEANIPGRGPIFSMVRFGNVMESSGSVIPLFRQQLALGGPLTVTHPEVIRYFMTIPEAAELVIQSCSMAEGGELFVLDMGEPVRIADLARQMIHLSGLEVRDASHPRGHVEIRFTGLRSGEKLFEELLIDADGTPTLHPKIVRAMDSQRLRSDISAAFQQLEVAISNQDAKAVVAVLENAVEGFRMKDAAPDRRIGKEPMRRASKPMELALA